MDLVEHARSDTIVLDQSSFKALASESRITILKALHERNHTLSELSQKLDLKHSTVKEHLQALLAADLVHCLDEGRKWKYYSLSSKGKALLEPERKAIWILLASSLVAIGAFSSRLVYDLLYRPQSFAESASSSASLLKSNVAAPLADAAQEMGVAERAAELLPQATPTGADLVRDAVVSTNTSDPVVFSASSASSSSFFSIISRDYFLIGLGILLIIFLFFLVWTMLKVRSRKKNV